jgi:hypothetical protein
MKMLLLMLMHALKSPCLVKAKVHAKEKLKSKARLIMILQSPEPEALGGYQ